MQTGLTDQPLLRIGLTIVRAVICALTVWYATVAIAEKSADQAILVLGDSLSAGYGIDLQQGWVQLLQARLDADGRHYRVINAAISGDTSGGALNRLPALLEKHQPAIVILEIGGNDGLRGTPAAVIRQNIARMIELCNQKNSHVLLLGMQIPANYGAVYARQFAENYSRLAREYKVALLPFFMQPLQNAPQQLLQADGIHPTAQAQPLLLENLWGALKPLLSFTPAGSGTEPAK